jgi:hypothetical protein
MKCEYCNGKGRRYYQPECHRPASECCGGCVELSPCHVCDGMGYLVPDYDDEFAHQVDVLIQRMHIRIILFKGHVANYLQVGNVELSDKYANRVQTCENALLRLQNLLQNHIVKQRL